MSEQPRRTEVPDANLDKAAVSPVDTVGAIDGADSAILNGKFGTVSKFAKWASPILTFAITLGALLSGFYAWATADMVRLSTLRGPLTELLDSAQDKAASDYCTPHWKIGHEGNDDDNRTRARDAQNRWKRINGFRKTLGIDQEDEKNMCESYPSPYLSTPK